MCILPALRRQGLGRALLEHFFESIRVSSSPRLHVGGRFRVVLSTPAVNTPALGMYAKFGFVEEERFSIVCDPNESTLDLVQLAVTMTIDSEEEAK